MFAEPHRNEQPCRALWAQVVLQAKEDLEGEPVGSILYDQAAAFFVGPGHWAESRMAIAELLEMHGDYLFKSGTRWIAARRAREGLPPVTPEPSRPRDPPQLPRIIAVPRRDQGTRAARPAPPCVRHVAPPPSVDRPKSETRDVQQQAAKRSNNWSKWKSTGMPNPFLPRLDSGL